MALVTCPDCGRSVSDAAVACPQCGRPLHTGDKIVEVAPATGANKPLRATNLEFVGCLLPLMILGAILVLVILLK